MDTIIYIILYYLFILLIQTGKSPVTAVLNQTLQQNLTNRKKKRTA